MIIPVGPNYGNQDLVLIEKDEDGAIARREVLPVVFVPFTRDEDGDGVPD